MLAFYKVGFQFSKWRDDVAISSAQANRAEGIAT